MDLFSLSSVVAKYEALYERQWPHRAATTEGPDVAYQQRLGGAFPTTPLDLSTTRTQQSIVATKT